MQLKIKINPSKAKPNKIVGFSSNLLNFEFKNIKIEGGKVTWVEPKGTCKAEANGNLKRLKINKIFKKKKKSSMEVFMKHANDIMFCNLKKRLLKKYNQHKLDFYPKTKNNTKRADDKIAIK